MKKTIVRALSLTQAFLLFCVVTFAATPVYAAGWDGKSAGKFGGGTGKESDPYIISEPGHLKYLAAQVNEGSTKKDYHAAKGYIDNYFILTADLDLNNKDWEPIGESSSKFFAGYFDGNGHTITNFKIDESTFESMDYAGLFGYVYGNKSGQSPVLIKNLNVSGSITTTANNNSAGGIVGNIAFKSGYNTVVIENCTANANITVNGESPTDRSKAGGIAGYSAGLHVTIRNCIASVNITSIELSPEIEAWIEENMKSENEITRAMMAVIVCRFIDEQGLPALSTAMDIMKSSELMVGDGSGEADPNKVMTKEQIVTVLYRVAVHLDLTRDASAKPADIKDLGTVSSWAQEAVDDFIAKGLIRGNADGYFNPGAHITLGELYQIYTNILNNVESAFEDVPEAVNVEEEIEELTEPLAQEEQSEPEEQTEPEEQAEQSEPEEQAELS